ncbi:hypothetical protein [Microbacterium plantarum]|nr:hypothetical protein [Microbacterium plantarum]WRK17468.1 hypothetical protein VC184_00200 [Microbacterium plantarum]
MQRTIVDPQTWLEVIVPDFATDEEALDRSRRREAGGVPAVKMEPDYGCIFPLWPESSGAVEDIARRLPEDVVRDLMLWQGRFEAGYVFPTGWRSDGHRSEWLEQGERLFTVVEKALWSDFDVIPSFRRTTRESDRL